MEPRPQRPRPQTPPSGTPPNGGQKQAPPIGPDPAQHAPHQGQPEHDPAAFVSPPRMDYDYSPLDLQPPGQRRKRQVIAGIIGALVVIAIGALIVAGWMALREDDDSVNPDDNNDRVAELTSAATDEAAADGDGETIDEGAAGTPAAGNEETQPPTEVPPSPTPEATIYDANTIRAALPVVESMPGPFQEVGDTPQELASVTEALGGGPEVEGLLSTHGWQAGMARTYESTDPATTGSTRVVVSAHAFKDDAAAQAMLPEFDRILQSYGWTSVEMEPMGDGSAMLVFNDENTGEDAVTIYFVDGQIVYRVAVYGPAGFDSTPNAIHVVNQVLGQ